MTTRNDQTPGRLRNPEVLVQVRVLSRYLMRERYQSEGSHQAPDSSPVRQAGRHAGETSSGRAHPRAGCGRTVGRVRRENGARSTPGVRQLAPSGRGTRRQRRLVRRLRPIRWRATSPSGDRGYLGRSPSPAHQPTDGLERREDELARKNCCLPVARVQDVPQVPRRRLLESAAESRPCSRRLALPSVRWQGATGAPPGLLQEDDARKVLGWTCLSLPRLSRKA